MPEYTENMMGKEGGYIHLYEIQEAHNEILRSSHILELKCLEADGMLTVAREKEAITNFISNYKSLMATIYDKIDGTFKQFKDKHSKFAGDKAFVKAMNQYIAKAVINNIKFIMYDYGILDKYADNLVKILPDICKKLDKMEKGLSSEDLFGIIAMYPKAVSMEEMQQLIKVNCYGKKHEFHDSDLKMWIGYLEDYEKDITRLERAKKAAEKEIKAIINRLDGYVKLPKDPKPGVISGIAEDALLYCNIAKNALEAFILAYAVTARAYYDRARNAKQLCLKCMYNDNTSNTGLTKESIEDIYRKHGGWTTYANRRALNM